MLKKGVIMCAWCGAIETHYGFVNVEWLPEVPILYTTCDQCRIRLLAENLVIYETHGSEERRCNYG